MIFKRMFDFVWKLQTVTLYCLLIMFIGRHSFATNIGLIKVVNYNLEKLNPLRKYTTIKLDIPKQTIPRPKKRRPPKKYEKKRKVATSGTNGFHNPVVIGRTDVELGRKSKRNVKRPRQKATATPQAIKLNHLKKTETPIYFRISELVKEIDKEMTNLMDINQISEEQVTAQESHLRRNEDREDQVRMTAKKEYPPTAQFVKKKSATFSNLIELGKQPPRQSKNKSNITKNNIHDILQQFIEEFKIAKDELATLAKQITIAANGPMIYKNKVVVNDDVVDNIGTEEIEEKIEEDFLESRKTKDKIIKTNGPKTEKDLFIEPFF